MLESERNIGISCSKVTHRITGQKAEYEDMDMDRWVDKDVAVYRSCHLITSVSVFAFQ